MKKILLTLITLAVASGILLSQQTFAVTISFQPETQSINLGESIVVDLIISDLGDHLPDSLSTYDLDLLFDPAILGIDDSDSDGDGVIDGVVLDPSSQLDIWNMEENWLSASISSPGILNLYDLSFDTESDLNNYQAGSFTLATITFDAIGVGTAVVSIDPTTLRLGDAAGNPLTASLTDGSINVSNVSPVPEPATCLLMISGLVGLMGLKRKKL